MSWLLDVEPPPKLLVLPPGAVDLGEADAAIEMWEHYRSRKLDPTQKLVVQVMMAQSADGRWAARQTAREMPRQNGKGDEIEVVELWGLVQRAERIMHTIHDAVLLATETQERMLGLLEGSDDLRRLIQRRWRGTGQQMIEMRNGGTIWYRTRSSGGGRGVDDVDRIVVDEAQHATDAQIAAASPTAGANTNPQLNAMGTSGLPGMSAAWWRMRLRALSPAPGSFGYVGHTVEDLSLDDHGRVVQAPVDVSDRSRWRAANPAVVAGRMSMEFLEDQFRLLTPEAFAAEHLGVWAPPPVVESERAWELVDEGMWRGRGVDAPDSGWLADPVTLAVEMPVDRSSVSVAVAGRVVGSDAIGVDLVERRGGTAWAAEFVAGLVRSAPVRQVLVDEGSPAGKSDLPRMLDDAGVSVRLVKFAEVKEATGGMFTGLAEGSVQHRRNPGLTDAARQATGRFAGDALLVDRRASADVAPFVAAILARWGHLQSVASTPEPDFLVV